MRLFPYRYSANDFGDRDEDQFTIYGSILADGEEYFGDLEYSVAFAQGTLYWSIFPYNNF